MSVVDALADLFFPGNPQSAMELNRLFAHRVGFRWGLTTGLVIGAFVLAVCSP